MATNEKDRFGDKLRDAERAREDLYFAERDRKLVEQLRQAKEGEVEGKLKEAAHLRCPKCGTRLTQRKLHEIAVEACPSCEGVWLDKGELEAIAKQESNGWIARWLRYEFKEK